MYQQILKQVIRGSLLLCLSGASIAGTPNAQATVFEVGFDDLVAGTFLGEGGSNEGEPSDLSALTAEVFEEGPNDNAIMVTYETPSNNASNLRWDFIGGDEITEGLVRIAFQFTPSDLDRYSFGVREGGGSSRIFLGMNYFDNGTFSASDAAGSITLIDNNYDADVVQNIEIEFDMDVGTSQMTINDIVLFSDREHGIDDRGVGRLNTGYSGSANNTPFTLDNIEVRAVIDLPLVLDVDLEDKVLGDAIGTGGPNENEPVTISSNIYTEVVELGQDNQGLYLEKLAGSAVSSRWEFLGGSEFLTGLVVVEVDMLLDGTGRYVFRLRENGTSGSSFFNMSFSETGNISASDANGFVGILGTYQANELFVIKLVFDMDTGRYSVFLDGLMVVEDREHGVTSGRGIGAVLAGFQSNAIDNSSMIIDNLQVGAEDYSDVIFSDGFE
ncbi:hypothetical protein OS175_12525 [Marinicella sp. S1101]|nr:hypothetical protein [Marinicella marina]MCX7554707.1 hypothetical protein [Marinicella marina]MDJ1141477.1 hypothetical protein [Marinicella marina]